jgi:hypothetical protein
MGIVVPVLLQRDSSKIDQILGKKHESPLGGSNNVDWSNCPLAKRYPCWERYHQALRIERDEAMAEGRKPHPAAAPPTRQSRVAEPLGPAGGLTVEQVKRQYGTKDPT